MSRILEDVSTTSVEDEAPANETAAEKFERLAKKRVTSALDKLRLIGNLAAPSYEYNEEQVDQILEVLRDEVDMLERKFKKVKVKRTFEFGRRD